MKLFIALLLSIPVITSFAETKLILTSKLDSKNVPVDNLTGVHFDFKKQYLMYVFSDDNIALNTDKLYFEMSAFYPKQNEYIKGETYTVDVEKNNTTSFKEIKFNAPAKYKIRVYSDTGDLVTKIITVYK